MEFYTLYYLDNFTNVVFCNDELQIEVITENANHQFNQSPIVEIQTNKLIDSIRVIGATTNHIASKKYAKYNFEFDYVIMDESGKIFSCFPYLNFISYPGGKLFL